MTRYLLAGGGTAGHVNPLLAVADELRREDPGADVLVLGTAEGLESRLVPERGYELLTIPRLPMPRRLDRAAAVFPAALRAAVRSVRQMIEARSVDVVVGFGGYAAAPAYLAVGRGTALALHEANAKPGIANRLGACRTKRVGIAFASTTLRHGRFVGMPLRREIADLDRSARDAEARAFFGLDERPTLLVTGGSLGSRRINSTVLSAAEDIIAAGFQVLHLAGGEFATFANPGLDGYHLIEYCDRMELALAVADAAVSRAGAATVSELTALGIPAVYVPYPVGNGEQRFNAADSVRAGAALLVADASFTREGLTGRLLPVLADSVQRARMSDAARRIGVRDGSERMVALIHSTP
ncbi:MAG: UDP-N-acetylglucosamine--N-acetylmuramyl-(pentapeptide) pyrophosphoryl-undecaprenol N-acetylglucosamine transferase [Microbacteriaceae bacterium]